MSDKSGRVKMPETRHGGTRTIHPAGPPVKGSVKKPAPVTRPAKPSASGRR